MMASAACNNPQEIFGTPARVKRRSDQSALLQGPQSEEFGMLLAA